jgi:ketosteroid isomerase-like protein
MKNGYCTIAFLMISGMLCSQEQNAVVNAELAFAKTAKDFTMKKAFLSHMDSAAVVFQGGTIYNGHEYWNKAKESGAKLLWHPAFFGLSRAGDLGFTTGPWEYRASLKDSVAASGQYTTIWRRLKNGEWKFLVDLGVDYEESLFDQQPLTSSGGFSSSGKKDTSFIAIEQKFITAFTKDRETAFRKFLHPGSWLNTDGKHPIQTSARILAELEKLPAAIQFEPIAGGVSASRDIAYVYGTIRYEKKNENYLRIWGRTGEGWKIILQVIKR